MKIDIKTAIIVALAVLIAGVYFYNNRDRNLPDGKITRTENLNLPDDQVTPQPIPGRPKVEISTTRGSFIIELRPDVAPNTVVNFLTQWSNGACNRTSFHRVEDWVIQGCDPKGDGTGGQDNLTTETSEENFVRGSVGAARKPFPKDKSNSSQFFILKQDSPTLNGQYTYFGKVYSGMDIVDQLTTSDTITSTVILTK